MADADRATCPRCGAILPANDRSGRCARCHLSPVLRDKTDIPPVSPPSPGGTRRKVTLTVISAVATIGVMLLVGLWLGNGQGQSPAGAERFFDRGIDLQRDGKLEDAIAAFREAIRIKPDFADAHFALGVGLRRQGELDEAIDELRAAIRIKPSDAHAHYNLGLALKAQGQMEEAVAEVRKARDNAKRGSELAQLIERALTALDR